MPAALFEQHLDLEPLGGRRRGLVTCIFHRDRTPSLSVDLDALVFHCFGCGAQGGIRRFAELVGAREPERFHSTPRESLQDAQRDILRSARRQAWNRPGVTELFTLSDAVRRRHRLVDRARLAASATGDQPQTWQVLDAAAAAERVAWWLEAEIDGFVAAGGAR